MDRKIVDCLLARVVCPTVGPYNWQASRFLPPSMCAGYKLRFRWRKSRPAFRDNGTFREQYSINTSHAGLNGTHMHHITSCGTILRQVTCARKGRETVLFCRFSSCGGANGTKKDCKHTVRNYGCTVPLSKEKTTRNPWLCHAEAVVFVGAIHNQGRLAAFGLWIDSPPICDSNVAVVLHKICNLI